jgi:hypothetical protein
MLTLNFFFKFSTVYLDCIEQMVLPSGHHLGGLLEDALEQGKHIVNQHTANNFPFMYFQKKILPRLAPNINKIGYFRNRTVMFCLELCSHSAVSNREQHISKHKYEILIVQEIHISRLELRRLSLEFVISFYKVCILDFGFRFGYFLIGSSNSNFN